MTTHSKTPYVKSIPMRTLRSSVVALMLGSCSLAALSTAAYAESGLSIRVDIAPPPLRVYEQPPIPEPGYIWTPGYWAWDRSETDYYWVPGTWVTAPDHDLLWTPAYWGWDEGAYVFHSGYWGREVGYYGGIDYGYGYSGRGYEGGRWEHGTFFYNRSVNNIANVHITDVYEKQVLVSHTTIHVSFNGGKGGTDARATPQQEAIAKERHVEATPLQTQHQEGASKNRALFMKENHGQPAIAATSRPGVFDDGAVSRTPRTAEPKGEMPKAAEDKKSGHATELKPETPKDVEDKKSEKPARTTGLKREAPKDVEDKKPEKPAHATDLNREAPKAAEDRKPDKPSHATELKREAPKAAEDRKPEKPSHATELKREAPKTAEDKRSEKARPASEMKQEKPNPEEEKKP